MKELFKEYKNIIEEFCKNKKFIIFMIITMILSYGFMLTNFSVGIDDLSLDKYIGDTYILSAGRWGTFLTYNIFQIRTFTPFWLDFIVILILFFTAICLCSLLKKVSNSKMKLSSYIIFGTSFISFPVISNFIVYQPTNLTVALSNLLMVFAVIILYNNFFDRKKKRINIILGLILAFPISMYESCCQSFVVLVFIVSFIYNKYNKVMKFKELLKFYVSFFITLLIGIIFNFIINKGIYLILEFFNVKRYNFANKKNILEILGFKESLKIIFNLKIVDLFANKSLYISEFLILNMLGFIFVLVDAIRNKMWKNLFIYIMIVFSNFILIILLLKNLYRVCYSWMITVAFIFVVINEFVNKDRRRKIAEVIIFFIILQQSRYMNQMFYNDYVNYRREVLYTNNIILNLQNTCKDLTKPLYFVKSEDKNKKSDLKLNEDNGVEYYSWAIESFYGEQEEIIKFFNSLGYDFEIVSNIEESEKIYDSLDEETKRKSIIELEDFIIVKIN